MAQGRNFAECFARDFAANFAGIPAGSNAPSLPSFSIGDGLFLAGDSISQQNNTATSTRTASRGDGYFYWASRDTPSIKTGIFYSAASSSGFRGFNFGIDGDAADDVAARTAPMVNYGAPLAILLCGTNTGDDNSSFEAKQTAIQSILADFAAGGIHTIIYTILPRQTDLAGTGTNITTAIMAEILKTNEWIRTLNSAIVTVCDPWDLMVDPAYVEGVDDEYGSPLAGMVEVDDGVHPTAIGAFTMAIPLRTLLQQIYPSADQYGDAWFAALTNHITNGTLTGTSGFAQNGVTGDVPTNCVSKFVAANADVSGVATVEPNADTGGQSHKVAITCGGNGSGSAIHTYRFQPLSNVVDEPSLSDGDWVRYFVKIRVRNNTQGLIGGIPLRLFNQSVNRNDYMFQGTATVRQNEPYPTGDLDIWLKTQPTQYAAGNIYQPIFDFEVLANVAGTLDLYIDKIQLSVVGDPATDFPYTP